MMTGPVFKLLTEADWAAAEVSGATASAVDLADGYVHLSTNAQVRETARRYFSGAPRVRLLRFDLAALGDIRGIARFAGYLNAFFTSLSRTA